MSTVVTGTLRDARGQLWPNAPVQFIFQPTYGVPGPYTEDGGAFNKMPTAVITDANGHFSIVVTSNTDITPASSLWQCIIGPYATLPAVVLTLNLVPGPMDISSLFTLLADTQLAQSMFIPRAYGDSEVIVPPNSGQLYYDVIAKRLKFYENGIWNPLAAAGAGMIYPGIGIAVSNGTSWDPSIDPARVAYVDVANNFTADQTINGLMKAQNITVTTTGFVSSGGNLDYLVNPNDTQAKYTRLLSVSEPGNTIPGGIQFAGLSAAGGPTFYSYMVCHWNQATGLGITELNTDLAITGSGTLTGNLSVGGYVPPSVVPNTVRTAFTAGGGYLDFIGPDSATQGHGHIRTVTGDGVNVTDLIQLNPTGVTITALDVTGEGKFGNVAAPSAYFTSTVAPFSRIAILTNLGTSNYNPLVQAGDSMIYCNNSGVPDTGAMVIAPHSNSFVGIRMTSTTLAFAGINNIDVGTGGIHSTGAVASDGGFFTGVLGNTIGLITTDSFGGTVNGNWVANNFYTSGAKAFRVTHPLDETKNLIHCCLEGPENGVFYRGEVVTQEGSATVTLPPYFEALTYWEDRSVLVSQIFEEEDEPLSLVAAGRIKDGRFRIRTSAPSAKVAWEVKAVRKVGVSKLEVEPLRSNT